MPSRQSCEDNKRCMRSFPNLSYAFSTSHRLPAPSAGNSSLARPSHVSGPSLLYVWCQVDHLCARRTDTGYTHRQSSMCMSRYQYFSLVKGGPYRPHTINTVTCVVAQSTMFRGCLIQTAEAMPAESVQAISPLRQAFCVNARVRIRRFHGFGAATWHVGCIDCLSTSPRSTTRRMRFLAS